MGYLEGVMGVGYGGITMKGVWLTGEGVVKIQHPMLVRQVASLGVIGI